MSYGVEPTPSSSFDNYRRIRYEDLNTSMIYTQYINRVLGDITNNFNEKYAFKKITPTLEQEIYRYLSKELLQIFPSEDSFRIDLRNGYLNIIIRPQAYALVINIESEFYSGMNKKKEDEIIEF